MKTLAFRLIQFLGLVALYLIIGLATTVIVGGWWLGL